MCFIYSCVGVILIALLQRSEGTLNATFKDREKLYKQLTTGYQSNLAPEGAPVVVTHFLFIRRVASLENGVLTLETWEDMRWKDSRLKWNNKKYNADYFQLPSRMVWLPDILLVNNAEQYNGHTFGNVPVVIEHSGLVVFVPPKVTKAFCQFDEDRLFEKNEISCTLTYMSWTHTTKGMEIEIATPHELLLNTNPNWKVQKITPAKNDQKFKFGTYAAVDYIVTLKRIK